MDKKDVEAITRELGVQGRLNHSLFEAWVAINFPVITPSVKDMLRAAFMAGVYTTFGNMTRVTRADSGLGPDIPLYAGLLREAEAETVKFNRQRGMLPTGAK